MRQISDLWRSDRGRLAHYVVAVFLAGYLVTEWATITDDSGERLEPYGWLVLFAVVGAVGLLLSRRWPFAAPLVTALALMASTAATDGAELEDTGAPFLIAILFLPWCLGYYNELRRAIVGLGAMEIVGVWVNVQFGAGFWDYFFVAAFMVVAWSVGFVLNRRAAEARELSERAAELERRHAEAAARAVDEERQRIARELHDVIAHSVSVMTVQAGAVRRLLLPEQGREREALESVEETGRQALTEMRRLVGLLKDSSAMPEYAPQPGMRTLDSLLDNVRAAGLPVELDIAGEPRELAPGVDLAAYRVVQEALTNALRYAGPAHAWVSMRWDDDELRLEIANDGLPNSDGDGTGHGLAGMRERVSLYGGEIESGPRDGGGYVVRARLPIEVTS